MVYRRQYRGASRGPEGLFERRELRVLRAEDAEDQPIREPNQGGVWETDDILPVISSAGLSA